MTEIENAEKTVRDLEDKRQHLIQNANELADERQRVSFAAHTGDGKARARLDKINSEVATQASEANARLEAARRNAAAAADREAALQLREKLKRFVELGLIVDDAFADAVSASTEMNDLLPELTALGATSPNANQLRVLGLIATKTAVMQIPWAAREWDFLAPNQRKSFRTIVEGWAATIESNIAIRLGERREEAA
jgi:hypothetical protein